MKNFDATLDGPVAKAKDKNLPQLTITAWRDLIKPQSPLLAEVLSNSTKAEILAFFEDNCVNLCRHADINRIRMVYETLRDHISNAKRDGAKIAAQLRDSAIKSLTNCLVALDLPRADPRLTRFHVELLYRMLDGRSTDTASKDALQDRRILAAECLEVLESAYPLLLSADAAGFVRLAAEESVSPTPGFVRSQLAAKVLSNLAEVYLHQQEELSRSFSFNTRSEEMYSDGDDDELIDGQDGQLISSDSDDEDRTEEVLVAAAEVLCMPSASNHVYDQEDGVDVEFSPTLLAEKQQHSAGCSGSGANPSTPSAASSALTPAPDTPDVDSARHAGESSLTLTKTGETSHRHSTASAPSSPRGILSATKTSSASSIPSKQSSRRSMLASVAEADEPGNDSEGEGSSSERGALRRQFSLGSRSALTAAMRSSNLEIRTASDTSSIPWTAASTPRVFQSEAVVLQSGGGDVSLKRFSVPRHIQNEDPSLVPRLTMTSEAQAALQDAAHTFLGIMRRLNPGAVAAMAKSLPPILRAARPSPTQLWPLFERQLSTGSTPLLRAVLDIYDQLPELFEGRGPCLIEKVLGQVNDQSLSIDHRVCGASWILRQHAQQRHNGGDLLLADSWEQLLPQSREPPQLAAIKVKALGGCLAVGIGDEESICKSVCSWEGFGGTHPSDNQLRAYTYALRILQSSACQDGPSPHRATACLVASILESIVVRPQLVPAVDAFLESCPQSFASTFLKAMNALVSGVDGQFEALRERPEDAPFQGTTVELTDRVKAALITRSSSLSGLMRGISFSLSFTKRAHSMMPMSARGSGAGHPPVSARMPSGRGVAASSSVASTPHAPLEAVPAVASPFAAAAPAFHANKPRVGGPSAFDPRALRSSVSAAFQNNTQNTSSPLTFQRPAVVPALALSGRSGGALSTGYAASDSGGNIASHPLEEDIPAAPAVPMDLTTAEAAESWLSASSTWEALATGILRHDLLSYRSLIKRIVKNVDVHPRGTLRTVANYTWQYKEYHPCHALHAKEAGGAILGLCMAACLVHLPCRNGDGWTLRQSEVAESVQNVLDAVDEGFPVSAVQSRCQIIAQLVSQEADWVGDNWPVTLETIVSACVDAAVQG